MNKMKKLSHTLKDIFEAAEDKVGIEGWKAFRWEDCDGDGILTGCVPNGVYRSGPRKGRPRFLGPDRRVIVTKAELDERATRYEADTGNCWNCKGSGQECYGWKQGEGNIYRTCGRCGGSGKSPEEGENG